MKQSFIKDLMWKMNWQLVMRLNFSNQGAKHRLFFQQKLLP